LRADFDDLADARFRRIVATGQTIAWPGMSRHLEQRMAGKSAARPIPTKKTD